MKLASAARNIALHAHRLQYYPSKKGPIAFSMHLGHAVSVLDRFGIEDEVVRAATWLHDILEDTPMMAEDLHADLEGGFNVGSFSARETVRIVEAVTDEPGKNRAERKAKTYPKIRAAGTQAVLVKLADRIANVEASLLGGRGADYLAIYKHEYKAFRAALFLASDDRDTVVPMWSYLDLLIAGDPATSRSVT